MGSYVHWLFTYLDPVTHSGPWWKDKRNLEAVRHYAHMSGLLIRFDEMSVVNTPLTLQACPYPKKLYEEVWALQPSINSLIDAVSRDVGFLEEALAKYV